MRRYAIVLGLATALAAATAAPAAAHTITPSSFDFGNVRVGGATTQFTVTAEGTDLNSQPRVVSGDSQTFNVGTSTTIPPASRCDGTLPAGTSCIFLTAFSPVPSKPDSYSAVVGMTGGPTATVTGNNLQSGKEQGKEQGKKKKCKKKGKKGAASAKKKKKCKKKGKK